MHREIIRKIKQLRMMKNLTQSYIADKLNITRSAYQKFESGESHVWAKYLDILLEIFDITLQEFFSDISLKAVNQDNAKKGIINVENDETLCRENREIYEKLLALSYEQITLLKKCKF